MAHILILSQSVDAGCLHCEKPINQFCCLKMEGHWDGGQKVCCEFPDGPDVPQELEEYSVTLTKDKDGKFGIEYEEEKGKNNGEVMEILEYSPAAQSAKIFMGDKLIAVNEELIDEQSDIATILENAKDTSTLKFRKAPKEIVYTVSLTKEGEKFGIEFDEYVGSETGDIMYIKEDSPAYKSGQISIGDQIIAVNGRPLNEGSNIIGDITDCGETCDLTFRKKIRARHIYSVILTRVNKKFGIEYEEDFFKENGQILGLSKELAAKSGKISIGDKLIKVNKTPIDPRANIAGILASAPETSTLTFRKAPRELRNFQRSVANQFCQDAKVQRCRNLKCDDCYEIK